MRFASAVLEGLATPLRPLSRLAAALLSAEFAFALFLYSNHIKILINSLLPWSLPLDETIIFLAVSVIAGGWVMFHRGIYVEGFTVLMAGLVFFAFAAASSLWSPSLFMARREIFLLLTGGLWSLLCASLAIAPERERVQRFLFFSGTLGLIIALYGWYLRIRLGDFLYSAEWSKIGFRSFYQLAGQMSAIGATALMTSAAFAPLGSRRQLMQLAGALVCFAFTFVAGSRLAMVGMFAGFLVLLVGMPIRGGRGRLEISTAHLVALVGLIAGVALLTYVSMTDIRLTALDRLRSLIRALEEEPGILGRYDRLHYLQVALQLWFSAPLLGVGLMGFAPLGFQSEGPGGFPHNLIAQLLAETGLVGFGLFILFLWSAYRHLSLRRLHQDPLLVMVLAVSAVPWAIAMFSESIGTLWKLYAFVALAALPPPVPERTVRPAGPTLDTDYLRIRH